MVKRPDDLGAFAFVTLARLRVLQLAQGCTPRVPGVHTIAVMAQMEVAAGEVKPDAALAESLLGAVAP